MIPPPNINQVELTRKRISEIADMSPIKTVTGSISEDRPNCTSTAAMSPRDAALTPSNRLPKNFEFLSLGINGEESATNTNEGRNIPSVASKAPGIPASI